VNGQVQHWNGQGGQPNGQGQRQWQGQGGQGQHWNGQGGQGWQGQRGGYGFQDHALRGRDQGRVYYNAGEFARQYYAERRFRFGGYRYWPSGWYLRAWNYGDFLPYGWFASQYYLDWADYGLPPPPIGCEWIAQGPDAVLVDVWTGEVLSVVRGAFYWNGY
jgi:Ni/Co efflux regulator RcnB